MLDVYFTGTSDLVISLLSSLNLQIEKDLDCFGIWKKMAVIFFGVLVSFAGEFRLRGGTIISTYRCQVTKYCAAYFTERFSYKLFAGLRINRIPRAIQERGVAPPLVSFIYIYIHSFDR